MTNTISPVASELTWDEIQSAHERHGLKWIGYNAESVAGVIVKFEAALTELRAKLEDLHSHNVDLERRNHALVADLALADETIERLSEE